MRAEGGFWARRRAAVAAEEAREVEAARDPAPEVRTEERPEEEILAELGLPDPDGLRPGDDFAAFMSRAVPEAIRRRALRRLWSSRPVLANLDGLVDYDQDFTGGGVASGTLATAYRVGRGLIQEAERLAEAAEAEVENDPASAQAEAVARGGGEGGAEAGSAPGASVAERRGTNGDAHATGVPTPHAFSAGAAHREPASDDDATTGEAPAAVHPPIAAPRRRMTFEFG